MTVGNEFLDLDWQVVDSTPFDVPFDMDWLIEFGVPDPTGFMAWGTARVATRPRVATETGRFP